MRFRFKRRPLAAAVLLVFSGPHFAHAQAQKPAAEQTLPEVKVQGAPESGFKTESITSGTRTDTPLRDIPQFINVVPQELMRSQGITTYADALRTVPGVTMTAPEGGTQAQQNFWLRGFAAGGDLFMDSVRDLGQYNRDLFNVESVEVLKGPSSLMFGRGSAGGVLNETSKTPFLGSLKEVGATLGSHSQKRGTLDLNVKTGESSAFRLNAMIEDSDSYRDTVETKKIGVAPTLRLGIGTGTDVTLSYYYLRERGVTDYGQPTLGAAGGFRMPPVSSGSYYGFANYDYTNLDTHIATLKVDHRITDNLSLKNTLRWANYQREMEASISQSVTGLVGGNAVAGTLAVRSHNKSRDNDDTLLINQTELTWKLATGAVKHTLLGGLELAREKFHRWNYNFCAPGGYNATTNKCTVAATFPSTPLLNPDPYTALSYQKYPNTTTDTQADTVALYLQDQMQLSEQWKALAGLRWERYASNYNTYVTTTGAPSGTPAALGKTDRMLSARAGLIWQPGDRQSYYVSWGNSYNPSGELGVYGGTGTGLTNATANTDPEENVNKELGAQWDFAGGTRVRTALFRNEKSNGRVTDPFSGGVAVLSGRQRVNGIELEVTGNLARNWDVSYAAAYMDGKVLSGGTLLAGGGTSNAGKEMMIPKFSSSLWTVYRFGGGWEVGGGYNQAGTRWMNTANTGQVPGYTVLNAMVGYVQKSYDVRLNLYNLTDKTYYIAGYENNPAFVLPGSPRMASLTLRHRFD